MSGLFGGYLSLAEFIGGVVLWLLIGGKAWAGGEDARLFRLAAGALVVGAILGIIVGASTSTGAKPGDVVIWMFVGGFFCAVFTGILEWIRERLE